MHNPEHIREELRKIQHELTKSAYIPADTMAEHFAQQEKLAECLGQCRKTPEPENLLIRSYLAKMLELQERTAKAVEQIAEQTKPKNFTVNKPFPSERLPEILRDLEVGIPAPRDLPNVTPPPFGMTLTLDELEWLQGWYENMVRSDAYIDPEEKKLATRIEFAIAEIERKKLGCED